MPSIQQVMSAEQHAAEDRIAAEDGWALIRQLETKWRKEAEEKRRTEAEEKRRQLSHEASSLHGRLIRLWTVYNNERSYGMLNRSARRVNRRMAARGM